MNPLDVIRQYYEPGSLAYRVLVEHSQRVTEKALAIAARLSAEGVDTAFIEQAAMLHDIGILRVHAPEIGCHGTLPYVCHGVEGARLLQAQGMHSMARVCENHVGVGITVEDIDRQKLPLPRRNMVPETLEEQIICYADKFYSKHPERLHEAATPEAIRQRLARYGMEKVRRFDLWLQQFGP